MGAANGVLTNNADFANIDTPRGESAKAEVRKLRQALASSEHNVMTLMAAAKFRELDKDNSGFLENHELKFVVEWVISSLGKKLDNVDIDLFKTKLMHRLDLNKDGKLDLSEFTVLFGEMTKRFLLIERAEAKFKEFDKDNSGFLENAELDEVVVWSMQAFSGEDPTLYKDQLIARIDSNKDGKLERTEFIKLFEEFLTRIDAMNRASYKFKELDKDNSGFLERKEIDDMVQQVLLAFSEKTEKEREEFRVTLLRRVDVNSDEKISLQEFTTLFDEMVDRLDLIEQARLAFQSLDKDNSGTLERSELEGVAKLWCVACNNAIGVDIDAAVTEMINAIDKNGDGKIDLLEFVTLFEQITVKFGVWGA